MARTIKEIIVHCAATTPDMDIGRDEIDRWHSRRGFKSDSGVPCGYHRIIRRDGSVEWGRPFKEIGAHCKGRNIYSIGICMVGGLNDEGDPDCNFTFRQYEALEDEIRWCRELYGDIPVHGHREYADKACPTFDATVFV
jgi:hypothetical protein